MSVLAEMRSKLLKTWPFQLLPPSRWSAQRPTYRDAAPAVIDAALRRSQARPSGNWYAFAASDSIRARPVGAVVAGKELVAWRGVDNTLHVGPGACPHLGANLSTGKVDDGVLVCRWHGLRLSGGCRLGWAPYPAYDDGVLAWVRLDAVGGQTPTESPVLAERPEGARMHAVTRLVGTCEARDVIANRMDPWHGSWFHPYSFTKLEVLARPPLGDEVCESSDRFLVAVTFRIGRLGVPVVAEFTSPEPRTIVMRILDGEGSGSTVETHATPLGNGPDGLPRTAVIEAVIAHSDRPGFAHAVRGAPLVTPFMRRAATRLWRDDLAYAERLFALRREALNRSDDPGG
ncbi:MAG: Rieske (2Fe-2S) protein [Actinomycetota bacterium]|nr:Rieske (2Fe-2S) protein [Actinomycetota bacterium]